MRRGIKIGVVALLLLIAGVVALGVYVRNHGFSAREKPSRMEEMFARNVRRIALPAGAREMKNPHPQTEASMADAREHFVEHCSICHGFDGRGNSTIGRNLYPKVPDMTGADTQKLTDGELHYIISNGIRFTGMPAWGGEDTPESMWALVAFTRRLPKLSPEELKHMQEMVESGGEHEMEKTETPQPQAMDKGEPAKQGEPAKKKIPAKPKPHTHGPGTPPH